MTPLSDQAIKDLRIALQKSYGTDFVETLSEEELHQIGELLLTILSESLKMEITKTELFTP